MSNSTDFLRIGVIRGGYDRADESIAYGQYVIDNLNRAGHRPVDIFVDKNGTWHVLGLIAQPDEVANLVDVFWNALFDEPSGRKFSLPNLAQSLGIPLISENDAIFGLVSDPGAMREFLNRNDIKTTSHLLYSHILPAENLDERIYNFVKTVNNKMSPVWIIQALSTNRYPQIIAKNQMDLFTASHIFMDFEGKILVNNLPVGRRAHLGIIGGFRGQEQYALVPLENRHEQGLHNTFTHAEKEQLNNLAKNIHALFNYPHHMSIDVVHTNGRGILVENINIRPLQHDQSPFCQSLALLGIGHDEVFLHAIKSALSS